MNRRQRRNHPESELHDRFGEIAGSGFHLAGKDHLKRNEERAMPQSIHEVATNMAERAIDMMDELLRDRIDLETYSRQLNTLDVDSVLEGFERHFRQDPKLVYCLDIFMILSSLQHQLEYQVAEYGQSVASEDIRMLKDLINKLKS